ncbi:helix-turn-helix transcriptional regulator [Actinomadura barringtoniae]|uniref:Helix-turn-helix transcriptional regulator n=1 Tax=Actinomadura barringtoniae TaxID=1427535 RepID=A0A939P8T8_9ACTN|nr:helix-turn-helix transcriptional regulator [Actinomadura barringtoniae]MBO2448061.1 helix-turn-helix transcriptional regulator [Actinomadura barringtoniae]
MSDEPIDPFKSLASFLAYELRHSREDAGLSQDALAGDLFTTRASVSAYENETRRPGKDYVVSADKRLGTRHRLEIIRHHAHREHDSGWLKSYLRYEAGADSLKLYEAQVVHALLQTERYARALLSLAEDLSDLDGDVAERLSRQSILTRTDPPPPYVWLLLDEAVLLRRVGGAEVMREQLEHLLEMSQHPRVCIQVVPFLAGEYKGLNGPLALIGQEDRQVAYTEAHLGGRLLEDGKEVRRLGINYDRARAKALSDSDTRVLINRAMEALL